MSSALGIHFMQNNEGTVGSLIYGTLDSSFFFKNYVFYCAWPSLWHVGSSYLVQGLDPRPPALGVQGLSLWTTRRSPLDSSSEFMYVSYLSSAAFCLILCAVEI